MNRHHQSARDTRRVADKPPEDPDFEWLIEDEPWGLQQLARLMYYLGWTPALGESDLPRGEQERIRQTVHAYRSGRKFLNGGRSHVGSLRGIG